MGVSPVILDSGSRPPSSPLSGMTAVPCTTPFAVIPAQAGIQRKSEPGFAGFKDEHDEEKG